MNGILPMYVNKQNDRTISLFSRVHVCQPLTYLISPHRTFCQKLAAEKKKKRKEKKEKGNVTFDILIPKPSATPQLASKVHY